MSVRVFAFLAAAALLASPSSFAQERPARPADAAPAAAPDETDVAEDAEPAKAAPGLDEIGERFVKLALATGRFDPDFVDAYHGPAEWASQAKADTRALSEIRQIGALLREDAKAARAAAPGQRAAMLEKLIVAANTRLAMADGETFSFDQETRRLYDVVAPKYDVDEFYEALDEINALLPGEAPLHERVEAFRNALAIPDDKLKAVFEAAIDACRERTLAHFVLPENERFTLAFVEDKPWSGYNWYQGDFESRIEVNTDFPIIIDRAIDLGCHEGYPGHHTWNVLLEEGLVNKKGWIEYSLYPLYSPLSLIAEGSANYGIELAFPGEEKIAFERDVLFPLAGLDPQQAETLGELNALRRKLAHARNYIARRYLNGEIDREEAVRLSMAFGLQSRARADQAVSFVEKYRGYVVNYNLGRDIVAAFVEDAEGETARWSAFGGLLRRPNAASDVIAATDAE